MSKFKDFTYYKKGKNTTSDDEGELLIINSDYIVSIERGRSLNSNPSTYIDMYNGIRILVLGDIEDINTQLNEP